jgi:signal transduction histidine kinase
MDGSITTHADAIDPRLALRVYAVIAALTGIALIGWGPLWFGGDLAGGPLNQGAIVRTFGSMIAAIGCLAAGLGSAADPASQRRGLIWLIAAHVAVGGVLATQWFAIWRPGPMSATVIAVIVAVMMSLSYVLVTMEGEAGRASLSFGRIPFSVTSILGGRGSSATDTLRSRYEQQIREAAKQEERNYLARDLHDSVKQQIFAIHTSAAAAQAHLGVDAPATRAALEQVRASAREAMAEMEAMLDQLRATPLDGTGLVDVLARQCEALRFRTGAQVHFTHGPLPPNDALGPGAHQALCRVAQEALANVGRHARATEVNVSLNSEGNGFTLEVQDNGAGFDTSDARSGMGMTNMQARTDELGGTLIINRRAGGGTTMRCTVPCSIPEDREEARRQMRNRGVGWAVLLALNMLFPPRSPITLSVAAIAAIGLVRCIAGYRVVSRRPEAAR